MNDSPVTTATDLTLSDITAAPLPETSRGTHLAIVAQSGIAGFAVAFLASMLAMNFIFAPLFVVAAPALFVASIAGIPATPGLIGCLGFALYAIYAAMITRPHRTCHRILAASAIVAFHAIAFASLPLLPKLGYELM